MRLKLGRPDIADIPTGSLCLPPNPIRRSR